MDNVAPDNRAERTDAAAPEAAEPRGSGAWRSFHPDIRSFHPAGQNPDYFRNRPHSNTPARFCPAAAGRMRAGMGPCVRADLEIRRKVTILQPNRRRPDAFPMTETEYEPKNGLPIGNILLLNQRRKEYERSSIK